MELEKIRNLSDDELKSEQVKAAEQLFRIRFQKSLGNNEGLKKLRTLKLDVARIKTIARERELGLKTAPVAAAAPKKSTRKKVKKD
jgi:large subunit ribosomal protein L29